MDLVHLWKLILTRNVQVIKITYTRMYDCRNNFPNKIVSYHSKNHSIQLTPSAKTIVSINEFMD